MIVLFLANRIDMEKPQKDTEEDQEVAQRQKSYDKLNARVAEQEDIIRLHQEHEASLEATLRRTSHIHDILGQNTVVVITNNQGIMTYVSDKFCQLTKYPKEELIGKSANWVNSGYHSEAFFAEMWDTISKGNIWQGEIQNKTKDGSFVWINMSITPLAEEKGIPVEYIAVRRDITNEKFSKDLLRFNTYILSHVNDVIVGLDSRHHINYWNAGAERLYGLQKEEVFGRPLSEAYTSIWINDEDEKIAMQQLAEEGVCEVRIIHKLRAGEEIIVEATNQVLKNDKDETIGLLAVIRNVSDRIQFEKELKNTLFELEKRNYELDNYVYKVSHDLKAPLSSMRGLLNLIKLENDAPAKEQYFQMIESRVGKLDDIILSILHHAKILKTEIVNTPIVFEEIIAACYEEIEHYLHWEKIRLSVQINQPEAFYSDEFRINVIIRNIISNAVKYMNLQEETNVLDFNIDVSEKEALLTIRDNGIGIDSEFLSKIFDMFFRAASISEGSGLGLYIVRQAIDKLDGSIDVESKKGKGTTFTIRIPNKRPVLA